MGLGEMVAINKKSYREVTVFLLISQLGEKLHERKAKSADAH